jgi:hypothetical protein
MEHIEENEIIKEHGHEIDKDGDSIRAIAKKTVKDSVFRDLFENPKYLLELYQALHPEDHETTVAELGIVTIKNVLLDQLYNDLGFTVGDKLLVLVEAQSSWTVNIIIRSLMYLAQTWQEHIETTGQNVYGSKKLNLPKPELYVIYTGDRKTRPEWITMSKEFFDGQETAVEVKVKILYGESEGDIISQYVAFTKVYNEQVKEKGRTREAVLETIRICKDRNILKEYLESREKEVVDIMMTLFDDEYILKTYVEEERKDAKMEEKKETALRMAKKGTAVDVIADFLDVSISLVKKWLEGSMTLAK